MSRVRSPEGACFLLAALLLVLAGRPARAESAGSIELLAGKRRELSVDPGRAEERFKVHLPFKLSGAPAPAALTVRPVSAMRGAREALSFLERVTGEVIQDITSQGSVLLLQIDLGKPVEPGVYDLQLRLDAAGAESWLTQVELVIPAAQLDPPPRQVIEIIRGATAPLPALHLHEASGHSRVTLQDISQPSALHDGMAIAPMLRFTLPTAPIRAGGTLDLTPKTAGELPLGTSTATVQLRAPELERPVEVAYEIRVRRGSGWICAFAALGLLLSWLVREVFARLIKLGDARGKVDVALGRLREEQRRREDAELRAALDEISESLRRVRWSNEEAAIIAALTAADSDLKSALKELKDRKAQARAKFAELKQLLETGYHLPPPLRVRLAGAAIPLEEAARRLEADDAAGATARLEAILGDVAGAARELGAAWRMAVRSALADLAKITALGREAERGPTRADVEAALKESERPAELRAGAKAQLERIDGLHLAVKMFELRVLRELQAAVEAIARVARAAGAEPATAALDQEMARLLGAAEQNPDEPEAILAAIAATLHPLILRTLQQLLPKAAPRDAQRQVEDRARQGDYLGAAQRVEEELLKAASDIEGTAQGDAFSFGVSPEVAAPSAAAPARPRREIAVKAEPQAAARVRDLLAQDQGDAPPLAALLHNPLFLPMLRAGTAALVGAVVVFAALAAYDKPSFVGTTQDLWAVFLWALGTNVVGAEALTALLSKLSGR